MNAEEYAKHQNVSKKTAAQWCRQGKIPAVKVRKEWQIDPVAADAMLPETQDGRQPRRATAPSQPDPAAAPAAPPPDPAAAPAAPPPDPAAAPAPIPPAKPPAARSTHKATVAASAKPSGPTLADAQRALAIYKAERERLALEKDKGQLAYVEDMETAYNAVLLQLTTRAGSLHKQIKAAIPHLTHRELENIERMISEIFESVASSAFEELPE